MCHDYLYFFSEKMIGKVSYECAKEGQLRIEGTNQNNIGHLDVCHNRTWGVICDNHWTQIEALVACRQLGLQNGRNVYSQELKAWKEIGNYTQGQTPRKQ